ncbi:MAG: LysR family transcriptional regulator [Methyloprofundus sp.]|nr:LysR family transcriptional regulator [Methyloprofundus sp.]
MALNPQHLLTFSVVARLKSITLTAQQLHVGQPAVSGQLKLLQAFVGEPLYERKGHQIELTAAGEGLLKYADKMDSCYMQAHEYVRSLQQISTGVLRIGATMTIASYYLPQYVVKLQTEYEGVQVFMKTLDTSETLDNLYNLDLGFIEGSLQSVELPSNYQVIAWQQDEIVLVIPDNHPLALEYPDYVPLEVFTAHQVIWREPGSGARHVVEGALIEADINAPVNIEVTGVSAVKESVRAGLGIGFSSAMALKNEAAGLASRRIGSAQGLTWQLNIIAPKPSLQSRAVQAFLSFCMQDKG